MRAPCWTMHACCDGHTVRGSCLLIVLARACARRSSRRPTSSTTREPQPESCGPPCMHELASGHACMHGVSAANATTQSAALLLGVSRYAPPPRACVATCAAHAWPSRRWYGRSPATYCACGCCRSFGDPMSVRPLRLDVAEPLTNRTYLQSLVDERIYRWGHLRPTGQVQVQRIGGSALGPLHVHAAI